MSTCHDTADHHSSAAATLTVALAGNPNSGKTTLFNALTGLRQKVGNYPGVTVEKKTGRCRLADGTKINIIDLPGTYSLISRSPDEMVAMEVLRGLRSDTPAPDAVIVVVDASNLQRNLYLVSQLVELGRPMVVALNMMDIAQRRGLRVSPQRLSQQIGVPVIPVVGHKKQGVAELKEAIRSATVAPAPQWPLPAEMAAEVSRLAGVLDTAPAPSPNTPGEGGGEGAFRGEGAFQRINALGTLNPPHPSPRPEYRARGPEGTVLAERLLIGDRAGDVAAVAIRPDVQAQVTAALDRLTGLGIDTVQADIEAHYHWIDQVSAGALEPACADLTAFVARDDKPLQVLTSDSGDRAVLEYEARPHTLTEKVDRILVHKVWGLLIFAAIMAMLFVSIFWLAQPIMDGMQWCITALGNLVTTRLPDGPVKDLINDGIFAGVGTVVVFVPQIALLFMFLAILEDSGYLARAAFLMDRLLAKVGLHGKSFIPLLSSFACAIPGIMATRTIENRKDRLATILVAPFMSCSARLPVYTLLIGAFFVHYGPLVQAGTMLACYALGILAAVGTALVFKRTFLRGMPSSFILEMPTYKLPQASIVARQVWSNASQFLKKAGTTIFAMSVILWALAYYPRLPLRLADQAGTRAAAQEMADLTRVSNGGPAIFDVPNSPANRAVEEARNNAVAAAQSEYSFAGRFGHVLEPVIRPLGYDWKMGVGLVAAFAARETFVSTEGIVYAAGNTDEAGTQPLAQAMQADHYPDGRKVWSPLVAISLLVWFVLAMQCMSTVAIVRRETGGWGWPIFMIVYMNALAYVCCLAVFQIGSLL